MLLSRMDYTRTTKKKVYDEMRSGSEQIVVWGLDPAALSSGLGSLTPWFLTSGLSSTCQGETQGQRQYLASSIND